ncbi:MULTISPECIES: complex I subunit 5 family protein [unclassified Oscillibacter]|uniref:complex I subunit 5 family protein n=1 Tax=unclassified Oscillibacter TaxID=2629304 RepID=UPI0025D2F554|nr:MULTISPECIES: proton-conducting transporter membrane subunit [unclassified Oscillibacter]
MLLLPILLPILGGVFVFRERDEKTRNRLTLGLTVLTAAAAGLLCVLPEQSLRLMTIEGSLYLALQSDSLGKFFMVLISGIWLPVAIFAEPYLRHGGKGQQFQGFYTMTMGTLMGLALADNFVTLYMFFELMTLLTAPLVLHGGTPAARRAGLKYLGYSVFGAGMALAGYFFLSHFLTDQSFTGGGALNLPLAAAHRPLLLIVFLVMTIGFGAKAGMMPMQAWLPTAHPVAPAPASAVLSGVITKGGVLAIIRVTYYLFGAEFLRGSWAQYALIALTLCTVFTGSMLALKEKILKKRLAYSTVSQVSYVLFGLLLLTPGGVRGALLQMTFHALAKDTLFLAAGAIIVATNFTHVDQLAGIGKRMPRTMVCFSAAALSIIGIPPMSGFISKWYLASAALDFEVRTLGYVGVAMLILSALMTAGYLLPIVVRGFFPGRDVLVERREVGPLMTAPMLVMSIAVLVLGLFPNGLQAWISALLPQIF